ncbi:MAG: hypothetical protein HRT92_03995 [Piscirickettsiaceae bacterium]|nr:hypothetical protein [Piscirickettsiaceae bacterium]
MITKRTLIFLLLSSFSTIAVSANTFEDNLRIHGFGTLGLTNAGNDNLGYRYNVAQEALFDEYSLKQNSNIGIQFDFKVSEKIDLNLQFLLRDRINNSFNKSVQTAYINYKFNPNFELRLGRSATDVYMISEYKQVSFAQIWAHAPTEFYGHLAVDFSDGIFGLWKKPLFDGFLRTRLWFSQGKYSYVTTEELEVDMQPMMGVSLSWENNDWQLRLTYNQSYMDTNNNLFDSLKKTLDTAINLGWPQASQISKDVSVNKSWVRYYVTGVAYNHNNWLVQSELGLITTETQLVGDIFTGYLSIGKRINSFTPFAMIGWSKTITGRPNVPSSPAPFSRLQQLTQNVFDLNYSDQKSLSLGVRWDIKHNIAIKAQWDRTWIDKYGGYLYSQPQPLPNNSQLDAYFLNVDFMF